MPDGRTVGAVVKIETIRDLPSSCRSRARMSRGQAASEWDLRALPLALTRFHRVSPVPPVPSRAFYGRDLAATRLGDSRT
jgi:hypothetical protein